MPPASPSDPDVQTQSQFAKTAGTSPIPGYVLLEPLGRGGFGEVWKCEAPGGLLKAIKFVGGDDGSITDDCAHLRQEYEAFQQIKAIRHPFLLSLERVELIGDELIMVMELADRQLGDRFQECREQGLPGIPREELLGYFEDAAEALDEIGTKYGLQHLDVKPANLFLTAGHVQVGDYGLVSKLDRGEGGNKGRGLTPRYVAPEVLCGQVHTRSDQYSLALVYQELLTGKFPYTGRTPQQLMIAHMNAEPDLSGLPASDRAAVGRALAKKPDDRFPSCREFVRALQPKPAAPGLRLVTPGLVVTPAPVGPRPEPTLRVPSGGPSTLGPASQPTHAGRPGLPPPGGVRTAPTVAMQRGAMNLTPPPREPRPHDGVVLGRIQSIVPVARLLGRETPEPGRPAADVVRALCRAADAVAPLEPGTVIKLGDGSWTCRFLTTMDPRIAQVRLDLLWEEGGLTMDTRQAGRVVFWKQPPSLVPRFWALGKKKVEEKKDGFEVVVQFPDPGYEIGEVTVTGGFFGNPPEDFVLSSERAITKLMAGVQRELNNSPERRKHPRIPAGFPVTVFPLHSDGRVVPPLSGRCTDVSSGGVGLLCPTKPRTRYAYVAFDGVSGATGVAVLVKVVRTGQRDDDVFVGCQYRLDLGSDSKGV